MFQSKTNSVELVVFLEVDGVGGGVTDRSTCSELELSIKLLDTNQSRIFLNSSAANQTVGHELQTNLRASKPSPRPASSLAQEEAHTLEQKKQCVHQLNPGAEEVHLG